MKTKVLAALLAVLTHTAVAADKPNVVIMLVLADLMDGNGRFVGGKTGDPEIKKRITNSATGQYREAVILSCLDSRVPVELVFDQRIGDIFEPKTPGADSIPAYGSAISRGLSTVEIHVQAPEPILIASPITTPARGHA